MVGILETDFRLKLIQAYGEFTPRMVAEAIDDNIKRIRRATQTADRGCRAGRTRPRFNET